MISDSAFGPLVPAIETAESGFLLGLLFLLALDRIVPYLRPGTNAQKCVSTTFKRTTLLISAVTPHNIPRGMSVGLSFALAARHQGYPAMYASIAALALGIGIQNLP
ncbi:MAG: hypothetical protein LBG43_06040 [Treponema sp.]|nr:hypothetical protein [Treponema sp.]